MKVEYPIEEAAVTPEYVLARIQQEWRECAMPEEGEQAPTFTTTIREWREAMDLVWWSPLGHALNEQWRTRISEWQWFSALVPAREKTLRGVCELLATQARRSVVRPARILGYDCPAAGVFLAVRSMLVRAGAASAIRPSMPLEPYLRKWPKVFLKEISRLAPDGLPFTFKDNFFGKFVFWSFLLGVVLLLLTVVSGELWLVIAGVGLFAIGWFGSLFGPTWFPGRLTLEGVTTFRELANLIIKRQRLESG